MALVLFSACRTPPFSPRDNEGGRPPARTCSPPAATSSFVTNAFACAAGTSPCVGGDEVTLATDGCDTVFAAWIDWGAPTVVRLVVSRDGGRMFSQPALVDRGEQPYLVVDGAGTAHIFFIQDHVLAHRATVDGATFGPTVLLPAEGSAFLINAEPNTWRTAAARGASEVAVAWSSDAGVWYSRLLAPDVFLPALRVSPPGEAPPSRARLCLAGGQRSAVAWSSNTAAFVGISEQPSDGFTVTPLGAPGLPDIDCGEDGTVLAAWAPRVGGSEPGGPVSTASYDGAWHPGAILKPGGFYPHVALSRGRALVSWNLDLGSALAYAIVDPSGQVTTAPVVRPDLDGDGRPDSLFDACARPAGDAFFLLAAGDPARARVTGVAIDSSGRSTSRLDLGADGDPQVDRAIACDARGGAYFVWRSGAEHFAHWLP